MSVAYLVVGLASLPAGTVLQGWFLPFVVREFRDRPVWQTVTVAWLVPALTVGLFTGGLLLIGHLSGRVPRGGRRWWVGRSALLGGVVMVPVAGFSLAASMARHDFLASAAFRQAERTQTGAAWQAGLMAGVLAPSVWAMLVLGAGWLHLRRRGRRVTVAKVAWEWSPRTRGWFGVSVMAAPWVGLAAALASRP